MYCVCNNPICLSCSILVFFRLYIIVLCVIMVVSTLKSITANEQ